MLVAQVGYVPYIAFVVEQVEIAVGVEDKQLLRDVVVCDAGDVGIGQSAQAVAVTHLLVCAADGEESAFRQTVSFLG